jgi:hypothetical protein
VNNCTANQLIEFRGGAGGFTAAAPLKEPDRNQIPLAATAILLPPIPGKALNFVRQPPLSESMKAEEL